ncbi:MAG: Periplasmic divalent cation tolerance protein CutA, partial [uncultured Sphingomonadaceae bacterium]
CRLTSLPSTRPSPIGPRPSGSPRRWWTSGSPPAPTCSAPAARSIAGRGPWSAPTRFPRCSRPRRTPRPACSPDWPSCTATTSPQRSPGRPSTRSRPTPPGWAKAQG